MHVLHLIDGASAQACATTLAMLADAMGRLGDIRQSVVLLGGEPLTRMARDVGVEPIKTLGVPNTSAPLGLFGFQHYVRATGLRDMVTHVHCWSIGAFSLASFVFRDRDRLLTLTSEPAPGYVRWLRVLCGERGGQRGRPVVLPISSTIRRAVLSGGVPEGLVHVLRPGIDHSRIVFGDREPFRSQWRITDANHKVIALLSDPPATADAIESLLAVEMAQLAHDDHNEAGPISLLVHPRQRALVRAKVRMRETLLPHRLILDDRVEQPWRVLPGCDLALAPAPHGGGLSLLWAMAANVPIVAGATYAVSEIIEDRHSALLTKPGQTHAMGHRITQCLADERLTWKLRDTARHEAFSFFSRQRYCQSMQTVYEQLASGTPVEVPDLEITGGLRFTGRA